MKTNNKQIRQTKYSTNQTTTPDVRRLINKSDKAWRAMVDFIEYAISCGLLPKDQWEDCSQNDMEELLTVFPAGWEFAVQEFNDSHLPFTWEDAVMKIYGAKMRNHLTQK